MQPPVPPLQAHWLSSLATETPPRSYDARCAPVSRLGTISAVEGMQLGLNSRQQPAFAVDRRGIDDSDDCLVQQDACDQPRAEH